MKKHPSGSGVLCITYPVLVKDPLEWNLVIWWSCFYLSYCLCLCFCLPLSSFLSISLFFLNLWPKFGLGNIFALPLCVSCYHLIQSRLYTQVHPRVINSILELESAFRLWLVCAFRLLQICRWNYLLALIKTLIMDWE